MSARDDYQERRRRALADDERLDRWSARFGNGRLLLVVAAIVLYVVAGREAPGGFAALGALFVASWIAQGAVDRRCRLARLRAAWYARALDRLDGKWTAFPSTGARPADADHPYARDLDVVGKGSLFQLLDTTRTGEGESTLGCWLLAASPVADLLERRESIRTLAPALDARERLALGGLDATAAHIDQAAGRIDEAPLVAWAEGPAILHAPTWLRPLAFALPSLTVAVLGFALAETIPWWPGGVLVALHLALLRRWRDPVRTLAALAEQADGQLSRLLPVLEAGADQPRATQQLARLHEALHGAALAVGQLQWRVSFFQGRGSPLLIVLGPILLWDLHAGLLLDAWQRRTGARLRGWLRALGEIEALHALATYLHEHPEDVFPEVVDGPLLVDAEALGHPLLPADRCVRNDVALPGPGRALLVTGSNMSGKSTLLRATGISTVMALAGLPVRASRLRVAPVQVATCMRVADSLQEGASFFLAEVKRLKRVVDLARGGAPLLFLLDEILQGTNTRERSLGARGVIAHLVRAGASGIVSTHDLSLVQLGDALGDRLAYAHFTDHVAGDRMVFDYRMRPGVVHGSNALRVMHANGLDVELPEGEPAV